MSINSICFEIEKQFICNNEGSVWRESENKAIINTSTSVFVLVDRNTWELIGDSVVGSVDSIIKRSINKLVINKSNKS